MSSNVLIFDIRAIKQRSLAITTNLTTNPTTNSTTNTTINTTTNITTNTTTNTTTAQKYSVILRGVRGKAAVKKFNRTALVLVEYEMIYYRAWIASVNIVNDC